MPFRRPDSAKNVTDLTSLEQVQGLGRFRGRTSWIFERGGSDQISPDTVLSLRFMEELSSQYRRRESGRTHGKLEPKRLVVVLIPGHDP